MYGYQFLSNGLANAHTILNVDVESSWLWNNMKFHIATIFMIKWLHNFKRHPFSTFFEMNFSFYHSVDNSKNLCERIFGNLILSFVIYQNMKKMWYFAMSEKYQNLASMTLLWWMLLKNHKKIMKHRKILHFW